MTAQEAATTLVEMAAVLKKEGYNSRVWSEAVAKACGVLLIDDVLNERAGGEADGT